MGKGLKGKAVRDHCFITGDFIINFLVSRYNKSFFFCLILFSKKFVFRRRFSFFLWNHYKNRSYIFLSHRSKGIEFYGPHYHNSWIAFKKFLSALEAGSLVVLNIVEKKKIFAWDYIFKRCFCFFSNFFFPKGYNRLRLSWVFITHIEREFYVAFS